MKKSHLDRRHKRLLNYHGDKLEGGRLLVLKWNNKNMIIIKYVITTTTKKKQPREWRWYGKARRAFIIQACEGPPSCSEKFDRHSQPIIMLWTGLVDPVMTMRHHQDTTRNNIHVHPLRSQWHRTKLETDRQIDLIRSKHGGSMVNIISNSYHDCNVHT